MACRTRQRNLIGYAQRVGVEQDKLIGIVRSDRHDAGHGVDGDAFRMTGNRHHPARWCPDRRRRVLRLSRRR
ncbi:MAG TPA: hypothetical protein VFW69_02995 [Mycobacterium sp.]|nr:hypothetical protein [Mycobacterium sp.]